MAQPAIDEHAPPPHVPVRTPEPATAPREPSPVRTVRATRLRRMARVATALVLCLLAVGAWVLWRLWLPLPTLDGTVQVAGVTAPVEVLRDVDGVPHIRAANEADAYFGLGYVHAQDRLWQMEFQRRVGKGRLAELLGPAALPSDRLFRTIGLNRHASAAWAVAEPALRGPIEAYVRGVNAFLGAHAGRRLPIEFTVLRSTPEPWRPEDVLVWLKVMAWELSTNWRDELLRARIIARVGEDGAVALMPAMTEGTPLILPEGHGVAPGVSTRSATSRPQPPDRIASLARTAERLSSLLDFAPSIAASNNWVVSGARTTSGRPLLANDPHLGSQVPAVWYLAHLQGGGLNAIGATLPGVPGIVIGHNERIAWGVTNVMTDNQDLFVERVNASNAALYRGAWEPMQLRAEVIHVKGAPDERILVRTTRHGPLVSDLSREAGDALALSWSALAVPDETYGGWLTAVKAREWAGFTDAMARFRAPMQNFVYADVDGNIGYYAPGAIPLRRAGDAGTLPLPGWTGEHDWLGEVPRDGWPRIYNPSRGFVATANNPVSEQLPYLLSTNWEPGYRAARIVDMIEAAPLLTREATARMQTDLRSAQVRIVLPWLRRARANDAASREALERLRLWDGTIAADSAQAAIYEAWVGRVTEVLFADDLGSDLWRDYSRATYWAVKALHHVIVRGQDAWCDDVRTPARETCEDTLGRALSEAVDQLQERQRTAEQSAWRWGPMNVVTFPHLPLHLVGWLRPVFSRSVLAGGDFVTVSPVMTIGDRLIVASYRQIVDLSDLDGSQFVTTTGQSGQLLSGRYDDLIPRWRAGGYLPMRFSRAAVDGAVRNRLVLTP